MERGAGVTGGSSMSSGESGNIDDAVVTTLLHIMRAEAQPMPLTKLRTRAVALEPAVALHSPEWLRYFLRVRPHIFSLTEALDNPEILVAPVAAAAAASGAPAASASAAAAAQVPAGSLDEVAALLVTLLHETSPLQLTRLGSGVSVKYGGRLFHEVTGVKLLSFVHTRPHLFRVQAPAVASHQHLVYLQPHVQAELAAGARAADVVRQAAMKQAGAAGAAGSGSSSSNGSHVSKKGSSSSSKCFKDESSIVEGISDGRQEDPLAAVLSGSEQERLIQAVRAVILKEEQKCIPQGRLEEMFQRQHGRSWEAFAYPLSCPLQRFVRELPAHFSVQELEGGDGVDSVVVSCTSLQSAGPAPLSGGAGGSNAPSWSCVAATVPARVAVTPQARVATTPPVRSSFGPKLAHLTSEQLTSLVQVVRKALLAHDNGAYMSELGNVVTLTNGGRHWHALAADQSLEGVRLKEFLLQCPQVFEVRQCDEHGDQWISIRGLPARPVKAKTPHQQRSSPAGAAAGAASSRRKVIAKPGESFANEAIGLLKPEMQARILDTLRHILMEHGNLLSIPALQQHLTAKHEGWETFSAPLQGVKLHSYLTRHVGIFFECQQSDDGELYSCILDEQGELPPAHVLQPREGSQLKHSKPFRIVPCTYFAERGTCPRGEECFFLHGDDLGASAAGASPPRRAAAPAAVSASAHSPVTSPPSNEELHRVLQKIIPAAPLSMLTSQIGEGIMRETGVTFRRFAQAEVSIEQWVRRFPNLYRFSESQNKLNMRVSLIGKPSSTSSANGAAAPAAAPVSASARAAPAASSAASSLRSPAVCRDASSAATTSGSDPVLHTLSQIPSKDFARILDGVRGAIMREGNDVALEEFSSSNPRFAGGKTWAQLTDPWHLPLKAFIARHVPEFFVLSYPNLRRAPHVACVLDSAGHAPLARPLRAEEGSPLKHSKPYRIAVCVHWLQNACRLGAGCSFLHSRDPAEVVNQASSKNRVRTRLDFGDFSSSASNAAPGANGASDDAHEEEVPDDLLHELQHLLYEQDGAMPLAQLQAHFTRISGANSLAAQQGLSHYLSLHSDVFEQRASASSGMSVTLTPAAAAEQEELEQQRAQAHEGEVEEHIVEEMPPEGVPLDPNNADYSWWYWNKGPGSAPSHRPAKEVYAETPAQKGGDAMGMNGTTAKTASPAAAAAAAAAPTAAGAAQPRSSALPYYHLSPADYLVRMSTCETDVVRFLSLHPQGRASMASVAAHIKAQEPKVGFDVRFRVTFRRFIRDRPRLFAIDESTDAVRLLHAAAAPVATAAQQTFPKQQDGGKAIREMTGVSLGNFQREPPNNFAPSKGKWTVKQSSSSPPAAPSSAASPPPVGALLPASQLVEVISSLLPADGHELDMGPLGVMITQRYAGQFAHKNAPAQQRDASHGTLKKFLEQYPQHFAVLLKDDKSKSPSVRLVTPRKAASASDRPSDAAGPSSSDKSTRSLSEEMAALQVSDSPASPGAMQPGALASPAPAAAAPLAAEPRIVRLQVHVPGVEKALQVYAESVEELRSETQEKLANKHPDIAPPQPLEFSVVPPAADGEAPAQRPALSDAQLWTLSKNTSVWILPSAPSTPVHVLLPGGHEPIVCTSRSLEDLEEALAQQLEQRGEALSDGVFFSSSAPTAAAPLPQPVASWAAVATSNNAAAPLTLFAVWRWCTVPLAVQRRINRQIDEVNGVCELCSKPFAHHSHLAPMA